MTKFANMKVSVPIDDALAVRDVIEHLQQFLDARGTETLNLPLRAANGEDPQPELPDMPPPTGRIHWPAVSVVLAVERQPHPLPTRKARRADAEHSP